MKRKRHSTEQIVARGAWCALRDLNPHCLGQRDFKSLVSTDSTKRAEQRCLAVSIPLTTLLGNIVSLLSTKG